MPKKVLIAEDDSTMITLLHTLLKMEGYEVSAVDVDSDISAEILRNKPDVLFMDVHLGQQSGLDIVDSIRRHPEFESLRIVMTSGLDLREDCLRRGADAFILKPFMPDELLDLLKDDSL
jgi:CheY-like chemotaxis protein